MFESPTRLILGLITGFIFGFFLQKGRVAKHDVIVGAFLLKDFTAVKIMATAAAVGSVGVTFLVLNGYANFHIKDAQIAGLVVGGILFGVGLVLYGYCPGTGVAASGEGHKDALIGMIGMVAGAMAYVSTFPAIESLRKSFPDFGKATFPEMSESSVWLWVLGLVGLVTIWSIASKYKTKLNGGVQSSKLNRA